MAGDQPCGRVGWRAAPAPEASPAVVLPTTRVAGVEPPASPACPVLVGRGRSDGTVIDALRTRRLDRLDVVEPTASELTRQLQVELPVSRGHLRTMIERYWDRDWRREHKGYDESPEDHLWRAAAAVSEMQDALDELET